MPNSYISCEILMGKWDQVVNIVDPFFCILCGVCHENVIYMQYVAWINGSTKMQQHSIIMCDRFFGCMVVWQLYMMLHWVSVYINRTELSCVLLLTFVMKH